MPIILNEIAAAKDAIESFDLGEKPMQTLLNIARYYMYTGKDAKETRALLEKFLVTCDRRISIVLWSSRIDGIMGAALRRPPVNIKQIDVSVKEIEKIKGVPGIQAQRLAFTLLCIAKYNNTVNPKNEFWVNTPDNEIMHMGNINTSIKRQCLLYSQLRDCGLIKFSKNIESLSVQVLFSSPGDTVISVKDFRNLGYQYMRYIGGKTKFSTCENCGLTFKENGQRTHKYCADCALKIKLQQSIESVYKSRERAKICNVGN